jgi:hypothetical protein
MAATPRIPSGRGARKSPRLEVGPVKEEPKRSDGTTPLLCVECRRPFVIDAAAWQRLKPSPESDSAHVADLASQAYAPRNNAPTVVFGTSESEPPQQQLAAGEWVKLSQMECLDHMFAAGDYTGADFPLCASCWTTHLSKERSGVDGTAAELRHVMDTLAALDPSDVALTLSTADTRSKADVTQPTPAQRAHLEDELRQIAELEAEEVELDEEIERLRRQEDAMAGRLNDYLAAQWLEVDDAERRAADKRRAETALSRLNAAVALEFLFNIDTDSTVPTINGLRLGRLPSFQTPPTEINAASGLLLTAVSLLRNRHLDNIVCPLVTKLVAYGDASRIEIMNVKSGKVESQDFFISQKFFTWRTYGPAWVHLVALVNAMVNMFRKKLQAVPAADAARHRKAQALLGAELAAISGEKVGGHSVKYGDATDHTWTMGVRETLKIVSWMFRADDCIMHSQESTAGVDADSSLPRASPRPAQRRSAEDTAGTQRFGEQ